MNIRGTYAYLSHLFAQNNGSYSVFFVMRRECIKPAKRRKHIQRNIMNTLINRLHICTGENLNFVQDKSQYKKQLLAEIMEIQ